MVTAAVTFYDVVVWLHISAVVIGFGPTFAYAMFSAVAAKEGPVGSLAVERAIVRWNMTGTTGGMVVVLLTGLYLAGDRWDFGDFFVSWGFVAILILFGVAHGYMLPRERRLVAELEEEVKRTGGDPAQERSAGPSQLEGQIARMGALLGILILLTIYVMTTKPFL
jgi:hypothetical protein